MAGSEPSHHRRRAARPLHHQGTEEGHRGRAQPVPQPQMPLHTPAAPATVAPGVRRVQAAPPGLTHRVLTGRCPPAVVQAPLPGSCTEDAATAQLSVLSTPSSSDSGTVQASEECARGDIGGGIVQMIGSHTVSGPVPLRPAPCATGRTLVVLLRPANRGLQAGHRRPAGKKRHVRRPSTAGTAAPAYPPGIRSYAEGHCYYTLTT